MNKALIIFTAIAAVAVAPAAFAKNGHGHGQGNGHGNGRENDEAQTVVVAPAGGWTNVNGVWTNPAGRTHPHGMPPGQAKKIARSQGGLIVGNVLPTSYPGYQPLNNYNAYNLPVAPAGYEYVRVGNDVYLRQTTNGVISNVISNLFR